jgi:cell division protein FtsQ
MKRIIHISLMVILVAGTFFLLSFADQKHRVTRYKTLTVDILNASDKALITEKEIRVLIEDKIGTIEGSLISMIDLNDLESTVKRNPYVSSCEVYQTIAGELIVKATVRAPLVRVMNDSGQQYFIDYMGYLMPVTFSHPSYVLIANGHITDRLVMIDHSEKPLYALPDSSVLKQVYPVALLINEDVFLRSFIDQIYINAQNEMELVPKIGSQQIIFGKSENAAQKLENLKAFYMKVMNKMDWNTYKVINIKYNNQVVCSK